jgi:hypothetical protein
MRGTAGFSPRRTARWRALATIVGDAETGADAGLLVDILRLAGADADLLDDFLHERRHQDGIVAAQIDGCFLLHDLDAGTPIQGIVGADHRPNAILELRNHLARAVIGRRVGAEEDQDVEIELHRVAADLHVALFEDIEQPHLDQLV